MFVSRFVQKFAVSTLGQHTSPSRYRPLLELSKMLHLLSISLLLCPFLR